METIANKPVSYIERGILNLNSGFKEKLLCDGPTFTAGDACVYSCSFCYVEAMGVTRGIVENHMGEVVRRKNAASVLRGQLTKKNGSPRFPDPADKRTIYASPLVDVAASVALCKETVELCKVILELTNWDIRLLSKSNLLPLIAKDLVDFKDRVIYGVSTGTVDDKLAKAFEAGTALVSKRVASLHWLQDNGYRTFGMVCPSLPYFSTEDFEGFSSQVMELIRWKKCEHVWAEVINVRGESMNRTCKALSQSGFTKEAGLLEMVSTCEYLWEDYSRATFLSHAKIVSPDKLRFLQYVNKKNIDWWLPHEENGAVLLGKNKVLE